MNDIQSTSTMPVKQSGSPILGTQAYIWKTGRTMYLSKRQMVCVTAWLKKPNYAYVQGEMKRELGKAPSNSSIQWLLNIPIVKEYLEEKWREKAIAGGWTREHWLTSMSDHLQANARYEAAKEDMKSCELTLIRDPKDVDATVGLVNAKKAMREAQGKRLAHGDLYGMNQIAKVLGFELPDQTALFQNISITQMNGNP